MIDLFPVSLFTNAAHKQDDLPERDAEGVFDLLLGLFDLRKLLKVDSVIGDKGLVPLALGQQFHQVVGVENQPVTQAVNIIEHRVAHGVIRVVQVARFGPRNHRNPGQLEPMG